LALEAAAMLGTAYEDGTWWSDLSAVESGELVAFAVAQTVPFVAAPYRRPTTALTECLRERRALLVLDNCEHVADAAASLVDALLRTGPDVRVLVTSREPLDVEGEVLWRVPSLTVPPASALPDQLPDYEAVRLFVERAASGCPGFVLDGSSAAAVGAICRQVDGMPLGIELAAALVGKLPLQQIAASLQERLDVPALRRRHPGRPARQRTLQASMQWSHDLLSEEERVLFRRLAVFAGRFTVDAAAAVCADPPLGPERIPALLARLVDRSLVDFDPAGEGRYRMLKTIWRHAGGQLAGSGEEESLRNRHFDHVRGVVAGLRLALEGPSTPAALETLDEARDEVRGALEWAGAAGRVDDARELGADLLVFWMARYPAEGLRRLEAALSAPGGRPLLRARAAAAASWLALYGEFDAGRALRQARAALDTARRAGDDELIGTALNFLGWAAVYAAPESAPRVFEESVSVNRRVAAAARVAHALAGRGFVAMQDGDADAARLLLGRSLDTARHSGDAIGVRRALAFLGAVAAVQGDLAEAQPLLEECLERSIRLGDHYFIAHAHDYLGVIRLHHGEYMLARAELDQAREHAKLASPMAIARTLVHQAHLAFATGDLGHARSLLLSVPAEAQAWGLNWYLARRVPLLAETAMLTGDLDEARRLVDGGCEAARDPRRPMALGLFRAAQARLALGLGDPVAAVAAAHDALVTFSGARLQPDALDALELLATARCEQGHPRDAAHLLGAANGLRGRLNLTRPAVRDHGMEAILVRLRGLIGESECAPLLQEAGSVTLAEAVALASRGRGERKRPPAGWDSLTPSETQIAGLVASGLSNAQVAQRLFVSPATIRTHLNHIYAKLGIGSRTQLAAEAARRRH
jgi:predicted ATPase/DNA-binding CsgD family transcriptional regulator